MNLFFTESDIDDKLIEQIIRPPRQGYSLYDLGPDRKNIKGIQTQRKDFQIKNNKNLLLQGSLYQPIDTNSTKLIIYLHGNAGCRMEASPMLNHLIPLNVSVLAFDFSGCGLSEGKYVTLGCKEVDDLDSVMKYINSNFPQYQQIGLWGRSMGAVVSLMYAGQPEKYPLSYKKIKLLILDSPFASFKKLAIDLADQKYGMSSMFISGGIDLVRQRVKTITGEDLLQLKIFQFASKCTQNAIFTYSPQDQLIHFSHSQLIMEHYQGQKSKFTFKGDHNAFRDGNYYKNIIGFIKNEFQITQTLQPQQHLQQQQQQVRGNQQFQQQQVFSPQNQRSTLTQNIQKSRNISQAPLQNNFFKQNQQENQPNQQLRGTSNFKLGGGDKKPQQPLNQSQLIHQQFQMNPSYFSTYDQSTNSNQLQQQQRQVLQPQTNYVNNQQQQNLSLSRQQQLRATSPSLKLQQNQQFLKNSKQQNFNNNNQISTSQKGSKGISLLGVGRQLNESRQQTDSGLINNTQQNDLHSSQIRNTTIHTQQSQNQFSQKKKLQNYQVQTVNISLQNQNNLPKQSQQVHPQAQPLIQQQSQKVLSKNNSNIYLPQSPRSTKQQHPQNHQVIQSRQIQLYPQQVQPQKLQHQIQQQQQPQIIHQQQPRVQQHPYHQQQQKPQGSYHQNVQHNTISHHQQQHQQQQQFKQSLF